MPAKSDTQSQGPTMIRNDVSFNVNSLIGLT
jgi:hypothetical protein